MKHSRINLLAVIICLVFTAPLFAQTGESFFGGDDDDFIQHLQPTTDGNVFTVGAKRIDGRHRIWIQKISPSGELFWEKSYPLNMGGFWEAGFRALPLPDGGLLVVGRQLSDSIFIKGQALAMRTNAKGQPIWKRTYTGIEALYDASVNGSGFLLVGLSSSGSGCIIQINDNGASQWQQPVEVMSQTRVKRIFPTAEGDFLLVGRTNIPSPGFHGVFVRKISPDGTQIWQTIQSAAFLEDDTYQKIPYSSPMGAVLLPGGDLVVTNPNGNNADIILLRYSPSGVLLETKKMGVANTKEYPYDLQLLPDGGLLITGAIQTGFPVKFQGLAMRINANGQEQWRRQLGKQNSASLLFSAVPLSNGHFLFAGMSNASAGANYDGWFLNSEADGNYFPWKINCQVVLDFNGNCKPDVGEPPIPGWFVESTGTINDSYITDADGRIVFATPDGASTFHLILPTLPAAPPIWTVCENHFFIPADTAHPNANLLFLVQSADGGCARSEVSITQPDLVRCDTSRFFVTVQNHGMGESGELLLRVTLDPELSLVSASDSFSIFGNSIEFQVPPMAGLQNKNIEIKANLLCDVPIGATYGAEARLLPVECASSWGGPFFAVSGRCEGDRIVFKAENLGGGNAQTQASYRIMADEYIIQQSAPGAGLDLPPGAPPVLLEFPADGRTYRMEMTQSAQYPGWSQPAAVVQGCGTGPNGVVSIGYRSAFRADDGGLDVSVALSRNVTAKANKITEAVAGFGLYNFVSDSNWIEFTARLHNPLPTVVRQVDFDLIFNANIDPTSFQPLAWTAPFTLNRDYNGKLRVSMDKADLAPHSEAHFRFRIRSVDGLTPNASGDKSLLQVGGVAYCDSKGPYALLTGFQNYYKDFLENYPVGSSDLYPPDVLLYGGRGYDFGTRAATASDGTVYLVGETTSYNHWGSGFDGLLVHTDAIGRALWLNAYDTGDNANNTFKAVVPFPGGGVIIAGNYRNSATNYLSDYYVHIARIDETGKMLWQKIMRPISDTLGSWVNDFRATPDGNFILSGYTQQYNTSNTTNFLMKITPDGNQIWSRSYSEDGQTRTGERVLVLPDGSFMVVSSANLWFGTAFTLQKMSDSGELLWSNTIQSEKSFSFHDAALTPDGGLLVVGDSRWKNGPNVEDYVETPHFIRFNATGDSLWTKTPIVGPFAAAEINGIEVAPDGGYFVVGEMLVDTVDHFTDVLLLKINAEGDTLWSRTYGSSTIEWAETAVVSNDRLLLWGYNQPRPPLYDLQSILVRTDLEGQSVSVRPEPSTPLLSASIWPNPATEQAHVRLSPEPQLPMRWELRSVTGAVMQSGTAASSTFDVEVNALPTGLYFFMIPDAAVVRRLAVVRR